MLRNKLPKGILWLVLGGISIILLVPEAQAVPSFGRQTGMSCTVCHTVFPELTPFGRNFKLTGYTMSKHSKKPYEWPPPVAGMFQASFTHNNKSLPPNVIQGLDPQGSSKGNDNVNFPQAISLFYGGRIVPHVGGFIQGTFDGVAEKFFLDNTDVRVTATPELFGKDLVLGITANNNPTVQDVLNTTPAFRFPAASGVIALTPAAGAVIDGALGQQVGGFGGYFYWNNLIYGEATFYRTARSGFTQFLGAGTVTDTIVDGVAPYWRVFLQHQWGQHSLAVGHYGMVARIFPEKNAVDANGNPIPNLFNTRGVADRFADTGFDAQYQYLGRKHIFTAQTTYIHEDQRWDATFAQGGSDNNHNWLDTYRINLNYYYRTAKWGTLGGTVGYFSTWGSRDSGLYAPDPGDGSRTGKPNSDGFILEFDYVPWWQNTKVTIQYTLYNRFNGARRSYDGDVTDFPNRRDASNNNTLYILVWQML